MRQNLQPRALAVFNFIVAYKTGHDGNSPTMREIVKACDLSSSSVANYALINLANAGLIERAPLRSQTRSIHVVGGRWQPPAEGFSTMTPEGNAIHVKGDLNMSQQTLDAIRHVADAAVHHITDAELRNTAGPAPTGIYP